MRYLVQPDGQLTTNGRHLAVGLALGYGLVLCLLCFLPQQTYPHYKTFSTPGILQIGQLYFLLTPFNTLVHSAQLSRPQDVALVFLQNVTNVALLFPLVLLLVCLFPAWRKKRTVIGYSLCISLFIEMTQLLLDALMDAGRVFEVDDLWTNTLGGYLAYLVYTRWCNQRQAKLDKKD